MLPATPPPPLPTGRSTSARSFLTAVLSLILAGFVGCAGLSLLTNSLALLLRRTDFSIADGPVLLLMLLITVLTYGLMALFPAIPKRFFLPLSLFVPVAGVGVLPVFVYFHGQAQWIAWSVSLMQVVLGLAILRRMQCGWKFRWPLFPERLLTERSFGWGNLAGMVLAGGLLVVPALLLGMLVSARLAVDHFTAGFVALEPAGLTMRVRHYVRDDGRKIMLVPMSHIGEAKFYHDLAASFPDDAVILMEGVTDNAEVVHKPINYSRTAASLGAVEQAEAFRPRGEIVPADVDMSSFSPTTLDMLNTALRLHAEGVTAETLPFLLKPTPPDFERQLMDDLLTKRNRHLLGVLEKRLPTARQIIVPWGAAHMPEIAREIQKLGFRQVEEREFVAIRFGS